MKSPRDRSMILVVILSAGAVVVAAGLTSGYAFSSLVQGSATASTADYAADTLELPVELVEDIVPALRDGVDPAFAVEAVPQPRLEELSPVVVEQVKSEMTRLSALSVGVPERAQALADQVTDGSGKRVIIVYWDDADAAGPGWTHTLVSGGATVRSSDPESVLASVQGWIDAQSDPARYEVILQD